MWDSSPPFFLWVWDVKGIILSSVEYQLSVFLFIGTFNEDLQRRLSCIRVLDQLEEENHEFPEENTSKKVKVNKNILCTLQLFYYLMGTMMMA